MKYLVEMLLEGPEPIPPTADSPTGRLLRATLEICHELEDCGRIVTGGPTRDGLGLAFILRADSEGEIDGVIAGLPLLPHAFTTVTPLSEWRGPADARRHAGPWARLGLVPGHVLVK